MDYAKASVEEFKAEIGGMAILVPAEDGFQIKSPVILKQVVTGGTCTLDKEELANYYTRTMKKVGTDISFVWWHSHGTGSTFWSGTDEKAIEEYGGGKWSVSLVVNAEEEYKLRVDWFKPKHASLEDTELEIIGDDNCVIPKSITEEVKELCSRPKYNTIKSKSNSKQTSLINGWGGNYNAYESSYNGYNSSFNSPPMDDTASRADDFAIIINDLNDALMDYETGSMKYNELRKAFKEGNAVIEEFGSMILPKKKHLDAFQKRNSPLANAMQMFRTNSK